MNTTIANRIRIEDPSDEIEKWAKDTLRFPNPEYVKKERMGFWTGRTPKELRLYEWDGNTMVLPFGVVRELMPMLKGTPVVTDFRQDSVIAYTGGEYKLYDYQKEAIRQMIEAKYGILKATTGSGKTVIGVSLIKALRKRALWICHTADLLKQSMERASVCIDPQWMGTITEGKTNVGVGVTFATVQTLSRLDLTQYRDYWDVVIVDECFPGDTNVLTSTGMKQIKDVTKRDQVITIGKDGAIETKNVLTLFKKIPHSLVKMTLSDGTTLVCTENHPILTEEGYKRADEITDHDAVCCLRETNRHFIDETINEVQHTSWEKACFLFGRLQKKIKLWMDGRAQGNIKTIDDKTEQRNSLKKNEGEEPDAQSGDTGESGCGVTGNESQTQSAWWERNRNNKTTENPDGCYKNSEPNSGVCRSNKDTKRKWIPDKLQTGHSRTGTETLHRSGRKFSLHDKKTGTGSKEGNVLEFVRVDSIEVQEQTSDGTYGGLCQDGYVYNLEVEENHNYFANGINVHNCHRVGASASTFTQYEKVLNHLAARRKIGLTATPERSDGLIKATFALIGKVVYEIPEEAIADKVMGVKIRKVGTDADITDDCLNTDGTINYVKLIERLTTDHERNKLIARKIMENKGHSCIILSDRLEQLKTIRNLLPYEMQEDSVYIDGKMQSKKAKTEREQALEDMRTGKKKYLFASVTLCKEGLDIPCLDRLFLASPVKYSAIVTQAVGRIRRTAEGKETPVVIDFVDDNIGFCQGAWKKRCTSYRKIGAEIEKGFLENGNS